MKVLTAPLTFVDGDVLPPEDVNALYVYARDAVADVASKRWAKSIFPIQCIQVVGTAITQASGALLVHRFRCPVTCVVERAYLNANMISSAEVTVAITATSGGATPTGATVPMLSTNGAVASAATTTTDVSTDRFVLTADTEYSITIAPAAGGTFSLSRCDITLHLAVDRWTLAGATSVPDFDPTLMTDASMRDASVITTNNSSMTTEVAKFANALGAMMPMVFHAHTFTSATDADLLTFTIPRIASARGKCVIKRIYLFVETDVAGAAADVVTATIGATTVTADVNGVTYATADSGALTTSLDGAGVSASTTGDDLVIVFARSDAAPTCDRATAIVWVARG